MSALVETFKPIEAARSSSFQEYPYRGFEGLVKGIGIKESDVHVSVHLAYPNPRWDMISTLSVSRRSRLKEI